MYLFSIPFLPEFPISNKCVILYLSVWGCKKRKRFSLRFYFGALVGASRTWNKRLGLDRDHLSSIPKDKIDPPVFSSTSDSRRVKTTSASLSERSRAEVISEVMAGWGYPTWLTKNETKLMQCCCICLHYGVHPKMNCVPDLSSGESA